MDAKSKFTPKDLTVMTHMKREFVLYQVEESELTTFASGYASIHFGLFGLAFGGLISSVTTLRTAVLSGSASTLFFSMFFVSLLGSLYFGLMARRDYKACKDAVLRIKTQSKPMLS
jgi:hypothetical protein